MVREDLDKMCEETWGMGLQELLNDMDDFDFLVGHPQSGKGSREDIIEFFVTLCNRI